MKIVVKKEDALFVTNFNIKRTMIVLKISAKMETDFIKNRGTK